MKSKELMANEVGRAGTARQGKDGLREPYEEPRLIVIDLSAEEVLGGCLKSGCISFAQSPS